MANVSESVFFSFANRLGLLRRAILSSDTKKYIKMYYIKHLGKTSSLAQKLIKEDSALVDFWYKECRISSGFDEDRFEREVKRVIKGEEKIEEATPKETPSVRVIEPPSYAVPPILSSEPPQEEPSAIPTDIPDEPKEEDRPLTKEERQRFISVLIFSFCKFHEVTDESSGEGMVDYFRKIEPEITREQVIKFIDSIRVNFARHLYSYHDDDIPF